ncbi:MULTISPECIES: hypothetical protein [unclassified Microbispora]|uniref:hypothetical protein n=1 Tax=Microbispora sp. CL1-1 TaxID=2720026 RepID=UPI00197B0E13|nr:MULTISPECIES: hypothetical protein [unclassified Microbispora]
MCMPVAYTSARACPPVHVVPLNSRSRAWSSGPVRSSKSADLYAVNDSPVSVDRSISTAPSSIRASADTRSPSSTTSTSPGTSPMASITWSRPSLTTLALAGR